MMNTNKRRWVMQYFLLLILVFIGVFCKSESGGNTDSLFWLLVYNFTEQTSYKECNVNTWTNPFGFTDQKGDVKIGTFQTVGENVEFLDLIAGKIEKTDDSLLLEMEVGSLPKSIPINQVSEYELPEYEWTYQFMKEEELYSIGIIYEPSGLEHSKNMEDFPVLVLKNYNNIGACSSPTTQDNYLNYTCDINSLPELKAIDESYTFNVKLLYRNQNAVFKDCY